MTHLDFEAALPGVGLQFLAEAGLSDAGLAHDQRHPAAAGGGSFEGLGQACHRADASDELRAFARRLVLGRWRWGRGSRRLRRRGAGRLQFRHEAVASAVRRGDHLLAGAAIPHSAAHGGNAAWQDRVAHGFTGP